MADRPGYPPPHGYAPRSHDYQYRPGDPAGQRHEKHSIHSGSSVGYAHSQPSHSYPPSMAHPAEVERGQPLSMTVEEDKNFKDHLPLAIVSAAFCCWPVGILAVMKSRDAKNAYDHGDTSRAYHSAYLARRYAIWSISIGIILFIMVIMAIIIILSYRF